MSRTELSLTGEHGQSTPADAAARVGLGLLARFLGAVFLVLLGGLLLLDRALLRANRNQAELDAQAGALLSASFLSAQSAFLDRVSAISGSDVVRSDSAYVHRTLYRLAAGTTGLRELWVVDSLGSVSFQLSNDSAGIAIPAEVGTRIRQQHIGQRLAMVVTHIGPGHALISMMRPATNERGDFRGSVGAVFDGEALRTLLDRTRPDTRLTLVVLSGIDTVTAIGDPRGGSQGLAEGRALALLPNGGTWQVRSTHALATRSLRFALWALGVLGVLFLALGLLREQRRALDVASRSLELERLYRDVQRANQAKSEFLANVSHELRTPLNAIVGFVELLRDGFYGDLSPRQIPPVDRIAASATHLRHLVDQVLDIAKIAAGRLEVHSETIVLRSFVLNIASELESLVSEKGLVFSIGVGATLPRVRTDPAHLRQILINLIGNAVKYTDQGTIFIRARLLGAPPATNERMVSAPADAVAAALLARAPRSGTWIALQVVDTGVGVASGDLERIFDEFEQVNAGPRGDSMQRGTGLGLAISRRLARLLGGEISVDSTPGRGSTFTVWLSVNPGDLVRDRPTGTATPPEGGPVIDRTGP